jgi:hypothetical protein
MNALNLTLEIVGSKIIRDVLDGVDAIWWSGHVLFQDELDAMWTRLQRHLHGLSYAGKIYESPETIEESFSLERHHFRLMDADIPQAETSFVPLRFDPAAFGIDEVASRLREMLEDVEFGDERLFFRSYYGAQGLSSYMNAARTPEELLEGCTVLFEQLRERQKIGGLAFRKWLPISRFVDDLLGDAYRREYRVFIVNGEPMMWVWHGGEAVLQRIKKRVERGQLGELAPTDDQIEQMKKWGALAGKSLRSRLIAVDFAILEDESIALIDVNPGYCADWAHEAAYAVVYAQWLRFLTGQSFIDPTTLYEALDISPWGEGVVFGKWPVGDFSE